MPIPSGVRLAVPLAVIAGLALSACVAEPVPLPPPKPVNAVAGITPQKIGLGAPDVVDMSTRSTGTSPVLASWQYLSGAEAFNAALDARLLGLLDAQAGGRHEPSAHPSAASEPLSDGLLITHELVLATGSLVGARFVQTTRSGGADSVRTEEITYSDVATGVVLGSAALVNPDAVGTLRTMLREVPDASSGTGNLGTTPSPASALIGTTVAVPEPAETLTTDAELLSAITFTPAGEISITFDQDPDTGLALPEPKTVTLTAAATNKVVSPAGDAIRRAVQAGAAFNAPASAPGGAGHINCDIVACAALTYDDGPNAQTARLLEILDKHKVFATFFQQGAYVNANPGIARSVAEAGHQIANHTMSHPYLTKIPRAGITREIGGTQAAIERAAGVVPAFLRPPYGATNATVAATVGLPQVLWDVDSLDWQSRNKDVFIPRIMNLVKPGSVILQHDIHAATVDGQDELITRLKDRGYYLVTLPQLFAGIELRPGSTYMCRGTAPGCIPGR